MNEGKSDNMNGPSAGAAHWADDGGDGAVIACLRRHLDGGNPRFALPGGTTPVAIINSDGARALNWTGADIWPTDERDVPADHPASNGAMLARALKGSGATVHPLVPGDTPPPFDLVWLGVGMDGHVASIFPGISLADDTPAGVAQVAPDPLPYEAPFARQTLTMQALLNAKELIIVIRGEAKKAMLDAALAPGSELPVARLVRAASCPVTIYWSAA